MTPLKKKTPEIFSSASWKESMRESSSSGRPGLDSEGEEAVVQATRHWRKPYSAHAHHPISLGRNLTEDEHLGPFEEVVAVPSDWVSAADGLEIIEDTAVVKDAENWDYLCGKDYIVGTALTTRAAVDDVSDLTPASTLDTARKSGILQPLSFQQVALLGGTVVPSKSAVDDVSDLTPASTLENARKSDALQRRSFPQVALLGAPPQADEDADCCNR